MLRKLVRARETRSVVVATPESIKSCMLKYVDLLQSVHCASVLTKIPQNRLTVAQRRRAGEIAADLKQNAAHADVLQRVIALWGKEQQGVALLDEVDLLLHPLKSELNYPIGERLPLDLEPQRWTFAIHMLDAIFFGQLGRLASGVSSSHAATILQAVSSAIEAGVKCNAFQASPHITLLIPQYYTDHLQELMGQWAMNWLSQQQDFKQAVTAAIDASKNSSALSRSSSNPDLTLGRTLSKAGTELTRSGSTAAGIDGKGFTAAQLETAALHYVTERSTELAGAELIVEEHLSEPATKLLNLARQWVCNFMPHCMSKINRVSYGLLQPHDLKNPKGGQQQGIPSGVMASRWLLAVPFLGKDRPSSASEFAHPEVQIGLTILAYRYEGLRSNDVFKLVSNMKEDLKNESGPVKERATRVLFDKWVSLAIEQEERSLKRSATAVMASVDVLPLDLLSQTDAAQMDLSLIHI
eukprot:TRINITY_DN29466_c0_g1_i1.p1 TRINITY_DN29466_c0_g1~~TRINITY_DN29466_c0_g1_i1.p1  ORF type:complete len:469 (-),score=123.35 TRINITY_DN29466_c0_g1_i1:101-1507(-)